MAKKGKEHSGEYYVEIAEKNGLRVRNGKGDHVIIYGKEGRGYQTIPLHRELSPGVEHAVVKWFIRLGIVLSIAAYFLLT